MTRNPLVQSTLPARGGGGLRHSDGGLGAPAAVLLAALLWRANQQVPVDELADLVWDGAPPAGAREALRALVMRLRRQLGQEAGTRIVTRAPGYGIEVPATSWTPAGSRR